MHIERKKASERYLSIVDLVVLSLPFDKCHEILQLNYEKNVRHSNSLMFVTKIEIAPGRGT